MDLIFSSSLSNNNKVYLSDCDFMYEVCMHVQATLVAAPLFHCQLSHKHRCALTSQCVLKRPIISHNMIIILR